MADLVKDHFRDDPWEWIRKLNEDEQVRILGYWELSKKRNVDVGPVAATTLSQLLNVVGKSAVLLDGLGFKSRTTFQDKIRVAKIVDLRNNVMHPVRPMVLGIEDVCTLREAIHGMIDLAGCIQMAQNKQRPPANS